MDAFVQVYTVPVMLRNSTVSNLKIRQAKHHHSQKQGQSAIDGQNPYQVGCLNYCIIGLGSVLGAWLELKVIADWNHE